MIRQKFIALISAIIFTGCAAYTGSNFNELFGEQTVQDRTAPYHSETAEHYLNQVKPVIDNRCVVCHACYDAPCQYKMSSVQGIDRGGSKNKVYQGTRLAASTPTRLFEDAETTEQWREFNFHPVLNERQQSTQANLEAGLMAKMLIQKEKHPLPQQEQLEGFDFSLYRDEQCPSVEEHAEYEAEFPDWGMPYGMPNLASDEYNTLINWLESGAIMASDKPVSHSEQKLIARWETALNGKALKTQLAARYLYEHIYLFHLYFDELETEPRFFNLIRSATPPGKPVQRISTRRPYDDPGVERVYYRLIPEPGTIVDKTHMPYALNETRLSKWNKWFIEAEYEVNALPGYQPEIAANPMTAFSQLPVNSRFRFLLDNAQNTIMAFIKGPVCRGQLALNVINDRFWVFFADPDMTDIPQLNEFYKSQATNLKLPGELQSNAEPVINWIAYSRQQAQYLEAKSEFTNRWFNNGERLTTDLIWDGDGVNDNAALTIFRHFDSASVVKGLVGKKPKTAWIIDYALLERIHYLLVAGFDVYGNFGHQLMTRMYMDFLRIEGESHFVALLPNDIRHKELSSWYKDQTAYFTEFLQRNVKPFSQPTAVVYQSSEPKSELLDRLKEQLTPVLHDRYRIVNTGLSIENEQLLQQIDELKGFSEDSFPQISMILIKTNSGQSQLFSLLRNNAHKNISSLFHEEQNRIPEQDDLTLVKGVLGSYPAVFLSLSEEEVPELVSILKKTKTSEAYTKLLDRFAVRRSSDKFWALSDKVHQWYKNDQPIEAGLLDYNRLENR